MSDTKTPLTAQFARRMTQSKYDYKLLRDLLDAHERLELRCAELERILAAKQAEVDALKHDISRAIATSASLSTELDARGGAA